MDTTAAPLLDSDLTVFLRRDAATAAHWLDRHDAGLFRLLPAPVQSSWLDRFSRYYSVLTAQQSFEAEVDAVENGYSLSPCAPWIDGPVPWTFLDQWRGEAFRSGLYELPKTWASVTAAAAVSVAAAALTGLSWSGLATAALAVAALGRLTWVRRRYLCGPEAHGLAASDGHRA